MLTHFAIVVDIILSPVRRSHTFQLLSVLPQCALLHHLFLALGHWAQSPPSGVSVTLHDTSLYFSNNTVVTCGQLDSGHLSNGKRDAFTCAHGIITRVKR